MRPCPALRPLTLVFVILAAAAPSARAQEVRLAQAADAEDNIALIRQAAPAETTEPLARFTQMQTGTTHMALIEETGGTLAGTLEQVQTGTGHAAYVRAAGTLTAAQTQGADAAHTANRAEIAGVFAGVTAVQTQAGSYNLAVFNAAAGRTATGGEVRQLQYGNHNTARIEGYFSAGLAAGPVPAMWIEQHNDFNTAAVFNNGWSHNAVHLVQRSTATAAEHGNTIDITFTSGHNSVSVTQIGRGNTAIIRQ